MQVANALAKIGAGIKIRAFINKVKKVIKDTGLTFEKLMAIHEVIEEAEGKIEAILKRK